MIQLFLWGLFAAWCGIILYAAKLVLEVFVWICQQVLKLAGKGAVKLEEWLKSGR